MSLLFIGVFTKNFVKYHQIYIRYHLNIGTRELSKTTLPTTNYSPTLNQTSSALNIRHATERDLALLRVLDNIRKAVKDRKVTLLTLFEFSKTFDCIPYKKVLLKVRRYNPSNAAIKWLRSYLIDSYEIVIDNKGNICSWHRVSGSRQGSEIGPFLFVLFINDLPDVLFLSNHMIYADDTQIYYHFFSSEIHHSCYAA